VTKRIRYQYPFRGIFWDKDGTLTGLGENSWATAEWPHLLWDECATSAEDKDTYDGLICDNTIEVRSIMFDGYSPSHFDNQDEFVTQMTTTLEEDLKEQSTKDNNVWQAYIDDNNNNFSDLFMVKNKWAAPFVTEKRYYIRWGLGLDFEDMSMHLSDRWTSADKHVLFLSTHVDQRE